MTRSRLWSSCWPGREWFSGKTCPPPPITAAHNRAADSENYSVVVDKEQIVTCCGKLEALLAFVMTHSVLNLKFVRPAAALGGFVQRVLCIDDGTKVPSKAISLFRQLD